MFCTKCGFSLSDTARFCPKCGTPVPGAAPAVQPVQPQPAPVQPVQPQPAPAQPVQPPYPAYQPMYPFAAPPAKKRKTKVLVIVIVAVAAVLLAAAVAAVLVLDPFGWDIFDPHPSGETGEQLPDGSGTSETPSGGSETPEASESSGKSWQELYNLGRSYAEKRQYPEALDAFSQCIEENPEDPLGYLARAEVYVELDDTEENLKAAEEDFKTALDLDDTLEDAWLGLADVFVDREEYEDAQDVLEEALLHAEDPSGIEERLEEVKKLLPIESADYQVEKQDLSYYDDDGNVLIELTYDLVKLRGDAPSFESINQQLEGEFQRFFELEGGRESFEAFLDDPNLSPEYPFFFTGEAEVTHNANGIFSLVITQNWYMGGVYNCNYLGMTYDLNTGKELKLTELLQMGEAEATEWVKSITEEYLTQPGIMPYDNYQQKLQELTASDCDFCISDDVIFLLYPTYLFTPGPLAIPTDFRPAGDDAPASAEEDLLPADYVGMTVNELAEKLGKDFSYGDFWLGGADKPIYYTDERVPFTFYYLDPNLEGKAKGDEIINLVTYHPEKGDGFDEVIPGIPSLATCTQLEDLGYVGTLFDEDDEFLPMHGETAQYGVEYSRDINVVFYWCDHRDPNKNPPDWIDIVLKNVS